MEPQLLTANDRCDDCGAQAFVLVEFVKGDLLFCGHHWHKHKDLLEVLDVSVHDETDKILPAPSPPEDVE
jgi:hypothetical protein